MEVWESYLNGEWGPVITAAITVASALTMILKSKSSNSIVQMVLDALNILSLNILKNRNADR